MPSVSSTLRESGVVSFELKEQETKPNPKGRRRGKVVSTLRRETEGNVIGQESLTVRGDARERKRVRFDLKGQEYDPTPRAKRYNRGAEKQRKKIEGNIIGQQSFTQYVLMFTSPGGLQDITKNKQLNQVQGKGSPTKWLLLSAKKMKNT